MYVLSATEAISPALNRTRDILFRPFRWGTYLKLCAVGVLTEGTWANMRSNGNISSRGAGPHVPLNFDPGMITGLILLAALAVVFAIVLMYVTVRLRFALFHCLVHRTKVLTPGWHLYRQQAM